jgi:thioredoxin 1
MANSNLLIVDENNFDSVISSNKVVLIDFWAEWCGPCRMFLPTLAELSEEMKDKAAVGKVNVDENPGLSEKFGIMSIPTVYVFHNGKPVEHFTGGRPKAMLVNILNKYIEK